ncbi:MULTISPECIES: transposase [Microvirga]|uniref:transposase n=1 Tax=Microvirga TaxID=186650 RepID=UPI002110E858|nr:MULTISPECIES: transposase [unclassified Microvirga]
MRNPATETCLYACNLTDTEWALLEALVPRSHPAGRRQTYPLRRIVDAIFYRRRTGAQWRRLPHAYPSVVPSSTTMRSGDCTSTCVASPASGFSPRHRLLLRQLPRGCPTWMPALSKASRASSRRAAIQGAQHQSCTQA